jgi:hypothetical protein
MSERPSLRSARGRWVWAALLLTACGPRPAAPDVVEDARFGGDHEGPAPDVSQDAAVPDDAARDAAHDGGAEPPIDASVDSAADAAADSAAPDAGRTLRVLFVGNSYTYVNDLPAMLATLAARSRPAVTLAVESVTVGGATLQSHWESTGAQARLREARWDAVVLQGQSVEPLWQPTVFGAYADRFGALATTAGARALWFATWARRAGDGIYAEPFSGGTTDAMTARLESGYAMAQTRNGGALVRVGEAWRRALAARPALALHSDDGSHPSVAGTYLAACVFYGALVGGELSADSDFAAGVSAADAAALRGVAESVTRGM